MLPAEIIDYTLSFLRNDPAALKSCSAAHPILSSLAERYLFVHIVVYIDSKSAARDGFLVPQLASCLSERPYLAKHIRSITIDAYSLSYFAVAIAENFNKLSALLPLITHSEQLSLRGIMWFDLSTKLRLALLDFLKTDHMKTLNLRHSTDFPMTLLDDLKNIKNLTVNHSACDFDDPDAAHPIPTSLESLSLVGVSIYHFGRWGRPRLNTLVSLHTKLPHCPDLSLILAACSRSLTSLTLEIGPTFQTTYRRGSCSSVIGFSRGFQFNLSSLTSLKVLTVHADMSAWQSTDKTNETIYTYRSSVLAITQLAATAGPSLKHVVLNIDCKIEGILDPRDAVEWEALVQLCDLPIHPQVDLCLYVSTIFLSDPLLVENEDELVERGSVVIKPFPDLD